MYIPESVYQTLKVLLLGFALGKVVRGGESERGRGGRDLVVTPRLGGPMLVPFWLPFRSSKIVLTNSAKKRAHGHPNGFQGELQIDKKHAKVSSRRRPV